jgi:hypothetical protein
MIGASASSAPQCKTNLALRFTGLKILTKMKIALALALACAWAHRRKIVCVVGA